MFIFAITIIYSTNIFAMKISSLFRHLLLVAVLFLLPSCNGKTFDENGIIETDFEKRRAALQGSGCFDVFDTELSGERLEAMQFLYAYMPLPDIVDYTAAFYLQNVDYALKARAEMPWGSAVPVREFLHFVLPVRVNNEDMDSSRAVFYNELKDRVINLTMEEAVLEVNHWCHEKVTYTPSDIRTSSPLASVRTAYGRCGEESTFTVAALRAVGIPARQVYTPRWAHTDDNHAWVEAWVDGKWHFLGACEPEPVLDLAWFNAPASRGMLMHTKVFGNYNGPEEVVGRTPCYTEINVTANYAPVAPVTVRVVDENGIPVSTDVEYKIYNYAEFFTAAVRRSNDDGYATLSTGLGSLLVWAAKDGKFGYALCNAGNSDTVTLVIDKASGYEAVLEMDITPPCERNTVPAVTPEQAACNSARFATEDSLRNAYVATFMSRDDADCLAAEIGADKAIIRDFIAQSRGNHAVIKEFLQWGAKENLERALALLKVVSAKDLRDIAPDVLRDHMCNVPAARFSANIFYPYVLNPRVSNEMLTPYKEFFNEHISPATAESFADNPQEWASWCRENITVENEWNPLSLCMSPAGVWNMRKCDAHSRDIFFVAGARSMGIPARIDEVTGKTQYYTNEQGWADVDFTGTGGAVAPAGVLVAPFEPSSFIDNPRYYSHFSLSKIVNGKLQLQSYPENATWQSLLKDGSAVDAGDYLMVTGTRMADGGVLARLSFFAVGEGARKELPYVQRESKEKLQVIGAFNSENLFFDTANNVQRSLLSATGRGYYIIALIAPNSEPTNHFLRDVMPYARRFEEWGQKMVLLFAGSGEAARFVNDFPLLPSTVVWGTDINGNIHNEIVANMKLQNPTYPIILVANTFNRVVFMSQGYSIGLGEQLAKVVKQLSE